MSDIPNVIYGKTVDGKWYSCPHCKTSFDFNEVMNGEAAKRIDGYERIYRCNKCGKDFRMPE